MIEIDNIDDPRIRPYARLTEPQLRNRLEPEQGIFIAESKPVIEAALDAGCEPLSLLTERRHVEGQARAIIERCPQMPVYTGDGAVLEGITGYALTRGILCAMRRPRRLTMEEVCADNRRIVVVDSVVNATNIGAIFRGAAALGMDGVVLSSTCCDPLNRRSVRVSMGTVFQIPWTRTEELPGLLPVIERLKTLGFSTAAMALRDGAISIADPRLAAESRLAVILGNEGSGLSNEAIDACDHVVKIPMQHGVDSLNVAAAAAVAFWQLSQ